MLKFLKFLFWGLCSFVLNVALFMTFGVLVAFLFMALSGDVPPMVKSTSPLLAEFLDSSEKSKEFSMDELNEGAFNLILECAKKQSLAEQNAVSAPISPTFSVSRKNIEVCIPFSARVFSKNIKLGAFVGLSFDGDGVDVKYVYIGDARLPDFIAEDVAESLLSFYSSIKPLEKYLDILENCKIEVLPNTRVRIEK
ncbi:MAG: hypothetical protein J6K91_03355 [Opitutales bacterium]|nr:hypothetical protein [Opitutales bacterium]